jgi:hypothetical protein
LPALVSGDIPNNGANTTGNAATATSATNATNATTATNLANGANGSIPYQSGSDATAFIAAGSTGQILRSAGAGAPTWSTAVYPAAAGTAGNTLRSNGTDFVSTPVNGHSFTPADPGNTASGAGVMMGLGSTITFTPARSGIVLIIISGSTNNSTNGNYGTAIQLRYNTGSAPNYNTALTGTTAGVQLDVSGIGSTTRWYPFTINAVVSSLTVGSAYWIDLSLATIVGGTASIRDLNVSVVEL